MSFMDDFDHLKIQLRDIKLATNDFRDKPIGIGGFGNVYKGELSLPDGKKMVAFKRLDPEQGQGDTEFWKEIMMLSQYKHENLIALLHFCNEEDERILVYEYAPRGSLDRYLGDTSLSWLLRLKICHGAASGLNYLHYPTETHKRVLHRDIKSANILLDENLTAKVADFGLSKFGPANQKYTYIVSNIVGTPGYCDPMYLEMGSLSKESDVYSFGVMLFEVMCGRHCYVKRDVFLVSEWKQSYEENRLDDIVCKDLKQQIDGDSLKAFSSIAYRCLHRDRKERPTMAEIIKELEIALDHQETSEDVDERSKFEERISIANEASTPLSWRTRSDLALVLSRGVLLKGGDHWLSLNQNGDICEMISGVKCIPSNRPYCHLIKTGRFSSDKGFPFISLNTNFQLQASPRYLSPHVTYSINLVYKYFYDDKGVHVPLKYKFDTETEYWTSCVAQRRGELLYTELGQFTSNQKEHHFIIHFSRQLRPFDDCSDHNTPFHYCGHRRYLLHLVGVEFLPMEYEKDENLEEEDNMNKQRVIDLDINLEGALPSDYADLIKCSIYGMQWTTTKELYYLLRKGLLINKNGEQWFSISRSAKKRSMLPAKAVLQKGWMWSSLLRRNNWMWKSLPESRFELVAESCKMKTFIIVCEIESELLSLETTYACYLVYKLSTKDSMFNGLVQIDDENRLEDWRDEWRKDWRSDRQQFVDLLAPIHVPSITCNVHDSHIPRQIKGHPKLRKDGWMEIQMWDFQTSSAMHENMSMHCRVTSCTKWNFEGLLVQGIEFRPAKVTFALP